jgi:type II secretion system protein C
MQLTNLIEKLATPLQWLLVFGIAWTVANSVLGLLQSPSEAADTSVAVSETSAQNQMKNTDREDKSKRIEALINRHVFGLVPQTNNAQTQRVETAKATRLPLTLEAVFVADQNASSGAIVARSGKKGLLYKVGDILPGNARLIEVQQGQIILQRVGNREALAFGKSKFNPKAGVRETKPVTTTKTTKPKRNIASIEDIQGLIAENVESALSDFGLEANEGRGYKIGNLSSNPYLQQAGLRPGDIVLSVNGQPLGNIQKDQLEFDNIMAQGSASIELERNGEQMTITARLPN